MRLIYEIFPIFLFFLAFKFYDIYVATLVGIIATFIQVVSHRLWKGKWDYKQLITLGVFLLFGGLTLYFHNPLFVKWKPTIIFWVFAGTILGYQFFTNKPLIQRLMINMLQDKGVVPLSVWKNLNIAWALFFMALGSLNLYIAYFFSSNAWVNFKFYGIASALFLFSLFQTCYLMRYLTEKKTQ